MTRLTDIIGQEVPRKILLNSLNRGRIASTYLFSGKEGIGKWKTALWLGALLNCLNPPKDEADKVTGPCGECRNCRQVFGLTFPELYLALPLPPFKNDTEYIEATLEYIEVKKKEPYGLIQSSRQLSIPIMTAREIKRKCSIRPDAGTTRIVIFHEMERMLAASADSLLKLIEEPPPNTVIILIARDDESLLPTIQSRSQKIAFKSLSVEQIAAYLATNYEVPQVKGALTARLAEGSLGRALVMLGEDEEKSLRQEAFLMFKSLFHRDTPTAIAAINEMMKPRNKGATEQTLSYWQSFIGDLVLIKYAGENAEPVNIDLARDLQAIAEKCGDVEGFYEIIELIREFSYGMTRNVHIRPALLALSFRMRRLFHQSA